MRKFKLTKRKRKKNDINNGNISNDMQIRCNTSKMISATSKRRFPPPRISLCFVPLFFLFFSFPLIPHCYYLFVSLFFVCVFIVCNTGGEKRTVDLIEMKICVPILILLPLHTWALSLFCNAVARYLNMYSGKSSCRLELSALFLNPHNVWVINVTVNNSRGGSKLCMFIYPAVTSICLCLLSEFYVCVRVIMMRMWHTNVALSCSYSFPSRSNMKR